MSLGSQFESQFELNLALNERHEHKMAEMCRLDVKPEFRKCVGIDKKQGINFDETHLRRYNKLAYIWFNLLEFILSISYCSNGSKEMISKSFNFYSRIL